MYHIEITPEELKYLQRQARLAGLSEDVLQKLEWFSYYLESGESVLQTCTHFGIARSTFYRWLERFDPSDLHTLEEKSHRPRMLQQPKTTQTLVDFVRIYRMQDPFAGKDQIAALLGTEHGIQVSSSTVGRIITENNFYFGNSILHTRKRMEGQPRNSSTRDDMHVATCPEPDDTVVCPAPNGAVTQSDGTHNIHAGVEHAPVSEVTVFLLATKSLLQYVWGHFRRPIIVMSILANLAFISLLLVTAMWESRANENRAKYEVILIPEGQVHASPPEYGTQRAIGPDGVLYTVKPRPTQPTQTNTYLELSPDE